MESGDSIIISYSVIEQSDSFTYKQFNESNKAKVKMQVEGSNPIELEVSTKSAAVTFIGEEWYDINVKKALASSIKNVEENYFKYSYNIEINSTLGTKNHNIDFKDSLSINAQLNNNEITIENFRIYRVIDDYEQDITSNNYISLTENVNTETIPIECDIATGKLPPLKEGEKYVIKYDLKITNAEALEFYIDNKAEVKVGKLSTEDALATDSVPIDDDILLESSYSRREVEKYPTCGNTCSFYTINYKTTTDFIFNINSDNKTLRNDYTIEYTGYRKTFDQEEWIVELYDVNSLDSYETISLSLPLKFVRKGEKFYIFDSTGKKVEMHSRRDSLIIKNSLTTSDTYSVMVGLALKSGDNVLKSESSYAYVGGKKSCSPRNCNNEGSPYCNYIDKDDEVLKEFISVNKDEEKNVALFNWKTKIIPLNKYEFGGINYYDYLESDYEDFKAHYYTLEQIKNIKVYGLKNDGTQKDFNLDTDYKISAVLCDDINCSSTYYRDINVLTDENNI